MWTRCITMTIAPVRLSSSRERRVFAYHWFAALALRRGEGVLGL